LALNARQFVVVLLAFIISQLAWSQSGSTLELEVLRDPTRPAAQRDHAAGAAAAQESAAPSFHLSLVRVGGDEPLAIINGRALRVGDEINNAIVLAINSGTVTLWLDGAQHQLQIWRDSPRH